MRIIKWFLAFLGFEALRRVVTMTISDTMADTDLVPMREAVVQLDIGGVGTWVAVESFASTISPTRAVTPTSEEKTLDGANHTGRGTRGNSTIDGLFFATIDSTHPLYNLYNLIDTIVDVRWSQTGLAGDLRFYTSQATLSKCNPPGFDANGNMSAKFDVGFVAADILMEVIPT
jgi:hypothetical protein